MKFSQRGASGEVITQPNSTEKSMSDAADSRWRGLTRKAAMERLIPLLRMESGK